VDFRNERTWQNAVEMNKTEEFHAAYEAAVDKVRSEFGQKHPMIIGGEDVWATATFKDTSPADTKLVLGLFQKGGRPHAKQAIKAAKAAFPGWSTTAYADQSDSSSAPPISSAKENSRSRPSCRSRTGRTATKRWRTSTKPPT